MKHRIILLASLAFAACSRLHAAEVPAIRPEDLATPASQPADLCVEQAQSAGVKAIYYDGPQYRGKPTRVFAFLGMPANASETNKVPGIVLVHGGGGTAFEGWVKQWVDRGYAAIAMDTCGAVPIGLDPKRGRFSNDWQRLENGGPPGWGGLDQMNGAPEDNWMHQATAAVIRGHSLLRAQPGVDASRIGITGISWGGVLTCRAAGLDVRFAFAVPIYGCGFLDEDSTWVPGLTKMGEQGKLWAERYDPGRVLPGARMPMLWMVGTNDFAFPPDSWRKSTRAAPGTQFISMPLRMPHGHGGAGENPKEIQIFADSITRKGPPLLKLQPPKLAQSSASVQWDGPVKAAKAELIYTEADSGPWQKRLWQSLDAKMEPAGNTATVDLPAGAKYWFFHVTDERGAAVSTEYQEAATGARTQ